MTVHLDDLEIGTLFSHEGTGHWQKGSSCLGYGLSGKTECFRIMGGQIQRKIKEMLPNNLKVNVYDSEMSNY